MKKIQPIYIKITIACLVIACALLFLVMQNGRVTYSDLTQAEKESVDLQLGQRHTQESTFAHSQKNETNVKAPDIKNTSVVVSEKGCNLLLSLYNPDNKETNKTYTLTIKNNGDTTCQNTSVSIYYADNESFVSSSPKPSSSDYYWMLGSVKSGEKKEIKVTTLAGMSQNGQMVTTEACATADNVNEDACGVSSSVFSQESVQGVSPESVVSISPRNISTDLEYGTWVWEPPTKISDRYLNTILNTAVTHGINVIYITIDDYLEIDALDDGTKKEAKKIEFSNALARFVRAANAKGIEVDAEAGWRDWAEPSERYKGYVLIDYAIAYNKAYPDAKLRGFQYDVEPYLLPTYEQNKTPHLLNFVEFIDQSMDRLVYSDLRFSVVIPHFYDAKQNWTPPVTFAGKTDYTFNHILRSLDRKAGSSIILMSYRNFAVGENGSIEISKVEVDTASTGYRTQIIVGQETGNVEPYYVTFYGTSKLRYEEEVSLILGAFSKYSGFGGIAVHYIDPFISLK